jgi:ribosomal protection tetracycline resistance protein
VRTVSLGILAHVDAGKTTLTERLLYAAGVIDEVGSVDDGNTQTDTLALERRRGITIKSAVVSFVVEGITVNLIDTPGHPDFIAEVERVLGVLDGAVLVVSAVEGVQAQTRVLMRVLRRLRIPTLIFVNKIDRRGADPGRVLRGIAERLTPAIVAMGEATRLGTREAGFRPYGSADPTFTDRLADVLDDDALVDAFLADSVSYPQLRSALASRSRRASVHPVFFGSAATGAGVAELIAGLAELLPASEGEAGAAVSGAVFKVDRGPAGEKVAYVRVHTGTIHVRERLRYGDDREDKVTGLAVFEHGTAVRARSVAAGRIGQVWGLDDVRVGDAVGRSPGRRRHHFAPPSLETIVVPRRGTDRAALHAALTQLAEQDPLIDLRQDDVRRETHVSLYGEVQKEVIQATLAEEFGVDVEFLQTSTVYIERPVGTGEAYELIGVDPNPFLATVGLRVEPHLIGAGTSFRLAVSPGSMPPAFFRAVEETVREALGQGLYGWPVVDCVVTMTHSGYWARQSHAHATFDKSMSSTAGDFRNLTPLVLMAALRRAGTVAHEPIDAFDLEIPADTLAAVLPALARLDGVAHTQTTTGPVCLVEGDIPAARVHELRRRLPGLTRGEAVLESAFDHHRPVRGSVPTRPRTDHNPLNRKEYLLHVQRRV